MQIRVIFALPSLVPPPLVPSAAAPVAYPSIHHYCQLAGVATRTACSYLFVDQLCDAVILMLKLIFAVLRGVYEYVLYKCTFTLFTYLLT